MMFVKAAAIASLFLCGSDATKKGGKKVKGLKLKAPAVVANPGPREINCPPGYEHFGAQCQRWIDVPARPICAQGVLVGDSCILTRPAMPMCPPEFHMMGDICTNVLTVEPEAHCPPGFEMRHGFGLGGPFNCESRVPRDLIHRCPPGTVREGESCVSHEELQPNFYCLNGMLEGDMCVVRELYDCTDEEGCGHVHLPTKNKHHFRRLGGKKGGKKGKKVVVAPVVFHQPMPIEENFLVREHCVRECERVTSIPAEMVCPPGSELRGNVCINMIPHPLIAECPVMGGFLDNCFELQTLPAEFICPAGFHEDGFDNGYGGKGKHHNQASIGMLCRSSEQIAPQLTCEEGYILGAMGMCETRLPVDFACEGFGTKKHGHKGGYGPNQGFEASYGREGCGFMEFAEPIMTYSVDYSCVGEACGHGGKAGHGHK